MATEIKPSNRVDVAVVGGGFAGLSTAACLKTYGVNDMIVLEKGEGVGTLWTGGLDTLSMHTPWHSLPNDNNVAVTEFPMFKTKAEVCSYLNKYADIYDLKPHIRNSTTVSKLVPVSDDKDGREGYVWNIQTSSGAVIRAKYVVVASGLYTTPSIPSIKGANLSEYTGRSVHSWNLRNGAELLGQRVLIVGSGNSAAEAAVEAYFGGAASIDMLAGSPRHYISKNTMGIYYRLLMLYHRVGGFLGLLPPGSNSFDDLLYHLYYGDTGYTVPNYNSKRWCDAQIMEDRFQMLLSTDLSTYGLDVCAPLVFGESAYSRFHVLDGKRKGRRPLLPSEEEANAAALAQTPPGSRSPTLPHSLDKEQELGFIDLVKQDKINVINGDIVGYHGREVRINSLLNPLHAGPQGEGPEGKSNSCSEPATGDSSASISTSTVAGTSTSTSAGTSTSASASDGHMHLHSITHPDQPALRQEVARPYDVIVHASGFTHDLDSWIVDYNKYVRPPGQLDKDLAQARADYVAVRSRSKSLLNKVAEGSGEDGKSLTTPNSSSSSSSSSSTHNNTITVPDLPCRSNHPMSSPGTRQQYPWVGAHSRSLVQPSLCFVGFDNRKATLSLGYQGWDCGISLAKDLGRYNPSIVPLGCSTAVHLARHYGQPDHPAYPASYKNNSNSAIEPTEQERERMKAISRAVFVVSTLGTVALSVIAFRRFKRKGGGNLINSNKLE